MKASEALVEELYNQAHWVREGNKSTVTLVCDDMVAVVEFRGDIAGDHSIERNDTLPEDWGKRLKEVREQRLTEEK